jgi:trigger factor
MKTSIEPQEGNQVKLSVEIEEAEFEKSIDAAFRKIAHEIRLPGFRPGKAPRRILEKHVGKDAARQQAIQDSLPDYYLKAIVENDVDVIAPPELNITGGTTEGPISFEAMVEVRPSVKVPGYDGLQVTIPSPEASEKEIDAQVDRMRDAFASMNVVDRQAHEGDSVRINVSGTLDGEDVPGLTAEAYVYEVGSGSVVPELDTNLIAASAGEKLSFSAPLPDHDHDETHDHGDLQFEVEVLEVIEKVRPDATDEWAAGASEFATLAELRGDIAKRMGLVKRVQASMALRDECVKALTELSDGGEPPEALITQEIDRRLQDLAQRLSQQNATIDDYLEATGQSAEHLINEARVSGVEAVKADLALRAVVAAESIEVSDDEVATEIENLAKRFNMKPNRVRKNLEKSFQMSVLRSDIRKAKAVTWLSEHASIVDTDGKSIDRSVLEVSPTEFAEAGGSGLESSVDVDDDGSDFE